MVRSGGNCRTRTSSPSLRSTRRRRPSTWNRSNATRVHQLTRNGWRRSNKVGRGITYTHTLTHTHTRTVWLSNREIRSRPQKFSPRNFRHATPIYVISLTFCEMCPSYQSVKVFSLESFRYNMLLGTFSACIRLLSSQHSDHTQHSSHGTLQALYWGLLVGTTFTLAPTN